VAGSFFRPLALAYILAILSSLAVALTVTPAMSLILLPRSQSLGRQSPLANAARWLCRRGLPPLLKRPAPVVAGMVLLFAGAGYLYVQLKEEYLPRFQ
jgi:multidrug efflux pump subunit AcrB